MQTAQSRHNMPLPPCALKKHSAIWYCVFINVKRNWKPATQEWCNKLLQQQNGSAVDKKKKTLQRGGGGGQKDK